VIKQTKNTTFKRNGEKRLNQNRKSATFKSTSDALSSILNGPKSNGKAKGGEGNDNIAGDKGSLNGDPYAVIMDPGMGQEMAADGD
jgi:hypothetical protein